MFLGICSVKHNFTVYVLDKGDVNICSRVSDKLVPTSFLDELGLELREIATDGKLQYTERAFQIHSTVAFSNQGSHAHGQSY